MACGNTVFCFLLQTLCPESTGLGHRPVSLVSGRGPRKPEVGRNHPDPLPRSFGFLHTDLLSDFDQIRMLALGYLCWDDFHTRANPYAKA
jgi:hypothetical protein